MNNKQFNNKCLFCGKQGVTYEHFIPAWLGEKLNVTDKATPLSRKIAKNTSSLAVEDLSRVTGRPITSITIKRFCAQCNGGWMSVLEQKMKTVYEKFEKSLFCVRLSDAETDTLVAWTTLKTIEWSLTCKETECIPCTDINYFYQNRTPPPGWQIWVGHYNYGSAQSKPSILQIPVLAGLEGKIPYEPFENLAYNCQSTSICIGPLFIHSISYVDSLYRHFQGCYKDMSITKKIWPKNRPFYANFKSFPIISNDLSLILNHTFGYTLDKDLRYLHLRPTTSFEEQIASIKRDYKSS